MDLGDWKCDQMFQPLACISGYQNLGFTTYIPETFLCEIERQEHKYFVYIDRFLQPSIFSYVRLEKSGNYFIRAIL